MLIRSWNAAQRYSIRPVRATPGEEGRRKVGKEVWREGRGIKLETELKKEGRDGIKQEGRAGIQSRDALTEKV